MTSSQALPQARHQAVELFPGSGGLAALCVTALGVEHVQANEWTQPVTLLDVSDEDVSTVIELAAEQGVTLTANPLPAL